MNQHMQNRACPEQAQNIADFQLPMLSERQWDGLADEQVPNTDELLQAWQLTVADTRLLSQLQAFVEQHLAAELTGTLARLCTLSDSLSDLSEGLELDALVARWIARAESTPLSRIGALTKATDAAVQSGMHDAAGEGGLLGLLRTLRDPAVQRALKVLARGTEQLGSRGRADAE
jgi:hypothetical protein